MNALTLSHYSREAAITPRSVDQREPYKRFDKPNGLWVSVDGEDVLVLLVGLRVGLHLGRQGDHQHRARPEGGGPMKRECCRFHKIRARITIRLLPPCKREALAMGAELALTMDAIASHIAARATGDTSAEDQAEAQLRDLGVEQVRGDQS